MNNSLKLFCDMIRARSLENKNAMSSFNSIRSVLSPAVSILRQELDSMVRVYFLLSTKDMQVRNKLIEQTLHNQKWTKLTAKGKVANITDKDMVERTQKLHGWALSVYKFGCAYIHLSAYHNHQDGNDPIAQLSEEEYESICKYIRYYHGCCLQERLSIETLCPIIPMVFDKISENLECSVEDLEKGKYITY